MHAIGQQRLHGFRIQLRFLCEMRPRRYALDLAQAHSAEDLDEQPPHVELPLLQREASRPRESVMIVVQLFTGDEETPRNDVRGGGGHLVAAIAPRMADAIDDARREE